MKKYLKYILNWVKRVVAYFGAKSNFLLYVSLYFQYSVYSEFRRLAVCMYSYRFGEKGNLEKSLLLRRSIHRLEKGLLMKNLRSVFALDYINDAVNSFVDLSSSPPGAQLSWAYDVLSVYFDKTSSDDSRYQRAKRKFEAYRAGNFGGIPEKVPFDLESREAYMTDKGSTFYHMMVKRKSVRWFLDRPVPREKLLESIEVARYAPSSCNRQPYRYVAITEPSRASEIASISGGTGGWSDNIPCLLVLVGSHAYVSGFHDRHTVYVDATLSIMPLVLALGERGLSSCIINWVNIKARDIAIRKELCLGADEVVVTSIAVGFADEKQKVAYSERKSVEELVEFI